MGSLGFVAERLVLGRYLPKLIARRNHEIVAKFDALA